MSSHEKVEIIVLKSELAYIRRKRLFELKWLKRKHPAVFAELAIASEANDEQYLAREISQMNDDLSRHFNL